MRNIVQRAKLARQFPDIRRIGKKNWMRWASAVLCFLGCGYHLWGTVETYLEYPTELGAEILYPDVILAPAITLCNLNGFRRTLYCQDEENCRLTTRGEEVCAQDPELCSNKTHMMRYMIPDPMNLAEEVLYPNYLKINTLGHNSSMFKECYVSWTPHDNPCTPERLVRTVISDPFKLGKNCFTVNSLINRPLRPSSFMPLGSGGGGSYIRLVLDVEPHEYFMPHRLVKLIFAIHSPYILINSYREGLDLLPGHTYNFLVKPTVSKLLPPPFPAKCKDYVQEAATAKEGPVSEEECINRCIVELSRRECNCFPPPIPFLAEEVRDEEELCQYDASQPDNCIIHVNTSACYTNCPKDCSTYNYEFFVSKENFDKEPKFDYFQDPKYGPDNIGITDEEKEAVFFSLGEIEAPYANLFSKHRYVELTIRLFRQEMLAYSQNPKFQLVELCSFIGAYMGLWLGASLLVVNDLTDYVTCSRKKI